MLLRSQCVSLLTSNRNEGFLYWVCISPEKKDYTDLCKIIISPISLQRKKGYNDFVLIYPFFHSPTLYPPFFPLCLLYVHSSIHLLIHTSIHKQLLNSNTGYQDTANLGVHWSFSFWAYSAYTGWKGWLMTSKGNPLNSSCFLQGVH